MQLRNKKLRQLRKAETERRGPPGMLSLEPKWLRTLRDPSCCVPVQSHPAVSFQFVAGTCGCAHTGFLVAHVMTVPFLSCAVPLKM